MAQTTATPLLERERELALLEDAWRAAHRGRGSTWLVCAEAGGGKTRLMREFGHAAGGRVRWGAAEPLTPPEPFQAVLAALPGLVAAPTRSETLERAIARLAREAEDGPALLVLDDLHFADEGTVAALTRLAAECAGRPWLVLAAFRPGEGTDALRLASVELEAQGRIGRIDLPPLSRAAVRSLVAHVARGERAADPDAIHVDSGGNPWIAEALARGAASVRAVHERIVLRLDRLEADHPGALDLLRAIAPATRPLAHALLAEIAGGDGRALRRALTDLRDANVLAESEDGWQFRHEILRRSLLDGMIGAERRDAHRALAEAFARQWARSNGGSEPNSPSSDASCPLPTPASIAMHFAEAGDDRAAAWAIRAAADARAVDAHGEALAQLERALRFELPNDVRRDTLRKAELESWELGRWADGLRFMEEALALPGATPEEAAYLHQLAARNAHHCSDYAGDEAHLAAADRLLADRPPSREKLSVALARTARAATYSLCDELPRRAERAFALAAAIDDPIAALRATTQVQGYLAVGRLQAGDPGGFDLYDASIGEAIAAGLPAGLTGSLLSNAYQDAVLQLFNRQSDDLYRRVMAWIDEHELGWHAHIESHRILELAQRGRFAEARALRARVGSLRHMDAYFQLVVAYADVLLAGRAGTPDQVRAVDLSVAGDLGHHDLLLDFLRLERATYAAAAGDGALAASVYERAERRQVARIAGAAAVARARGGAAPPAMPAWLVPDAPLSAYWRWAHGIHAGDTGALRAVGGALRAMDCPYEGAIALRDAGDLTAAYRALRDLEATTERERTAAMLRAAGLPVPRRTRAVDAPGHLTDTELGVARLVVNGATNEEVAATLGMSAYTVATHLTHIYAKAGVRGRMALAAWWAERA